MKAKIGICFILLFFAAAGSGCVSRPDNPPDEIIENLEEIEGLWLGNLEVRAGVELRLLFNISTEPNGSAIVTLDSLDQGAKGIPVEGVSYKDGKLKLEARSIRGIFEGTVREDGSGIEGRWKQGPADIPLVLERIDKAPDMSRPQDPVKPYPYREEEVTFENKEAGIELAGTLTLPEVSREEAGPYPAVLLISGSGQQDRNEEIFGHRPFLVLADSLTRRGIAVLRVDDRGVGGSGGDPSLATTEDFVGDALAGVEYLKNREEIDQAGIGLIGHSEGGLIAPLAAVRDPDIAFIVLMAGPGLSGEEIIYLQSALIAGAMGEDAEAIERNRALQESIFTVLKEEKNNTVAGPKIRELIMNSLAGLSEEEKQNSGYTEESIDPQVQVLVSPWMRHFLSYDPRPALMEVKCPVLAINGEKDLQVPPEENLQAIEKALEAGGNPDYTIKEMPGLNHLFQTAETGSPSEYGNIQETVSPAVPELIGAWILNHS